MHRVARFCFHTVIGIQSAQSVVSEGVQVSYGMRTGKARSAVGGSHAQFNKGEQLHALCNWLCFGGDGALRHQQDEQKQETVHYLNLLTNVVVV